MKLVKMTWLVGAAAAVGLGMAAEACSSSSNTSSASSSCADLEVCCQSLNTAQAMQCVSTLALNNAGGCATLLTEIQQDNLCTGASGTGSSPGSGSSTPPGSGSSSASGTGSGTSVPPSSGSGTSTGSGSCETAPKLFPETAAGVYCPYSGADGGKAITCTSFEHCCEPAESDAGTTAKSTCVANAIACTSGATNWQCLEAIDCTGSAGGAVCCGTGTLTEVAACGAEPAYAYASGFTGTTCAASCTTYVVCEKDADCASGTCEPAKAKGGDFGHCL